MKLCTTFNIQYEHPVRETLLCALGLFGDTETTFFLGAEMLLLVLFVLLCITFTHILDIDGGEGGGAALQ